MKIAFLRFLVLVAADLVAASWGFGQSEPIPRIELKGGEKIPIANQFVTGGVDPIRCDKDGSIYMRPVTGPTTPLGGPILRISSDGLNSMLFDPRVVQDFKEAKELTIEDFTVGRSGRVYALASVVDKEGKSSVVILEFADDGHSASFTRMDAQFLPRQLALFPSGQFLLAGLWKSEAPKGKNGKGAEAEREQRPFIGIFDSRGKLIREILLPGDVSFNRTDRPDNQTAEGAAGTAVDLSRAVVADDGSIYFFRPATQPTIYVISAGGEILRHFSVKPPSEHATNPSVFLAAGKLVFDFYEPMAKDNPRTRLVILVADAQTGEGLWVYEPAKDLYGIPTCYSGKDFTFLSMTADRHLALLHASPQ